MNREGRRSPAGTSRMTGFARSWDTKRNVVGVYRLVVIGLVTSYAGGGGVVVVTAWVTAVTVHVGVSA